MAEYVSRTTALTLALVTVSMITACGGGSETSSASMTTPTPTPTPTPVSSATSFTDATTLSGINLSIGPETEELPIIFTSGVAAGDYDGDGDIDLLIVKGASEPNHLYRNNGDLTFTDVAAMAGTNPSTDPSVSPLRQSGPAFADMDGDGDLDIFIGGLFGDPITVLSNNGDRTFSDVSETAGFKNITANYTHSPSFGDYDRDGDLDLMVGHWGAERDRENGGDTEHLWRNESDATGIRFESVSLTAKIAPSILSNDDPLLNTDVVNTNEVDYTFSPTFARINDDLWPDILITGDFNTSQVFINNQDGTFTNQTDYGVIIDGNGMGSAVADYDRDGDLDWFVSSILASNFPPAQLSELGNRLYRNDMGVFTDVTDTAGVINGGWGWGSCFIDLDNNGDLDIYHTNGWFEHENFGNFTTDRSRAFISNGDNTFTEDAAELGLADQEQGRGIVCADFDNDGDTDILQLHSNSQNAASLWENTTDNNANYLTVNLIGKAPNTEAVGARIKITAGGKDQYRDVLLGNNFSSHNPTRQRFGLGISETIENLTVTWPDGTQTTSTNIPANQILTLSQ